MPKKYDFYIQEIAKQNKIELGARGLSECRELEITSMTFEIENDKDLIFSIWHMFGASKVNHLNLTEQNPSKAVGNEIFSHSINQIGLDLRHERIGSYEHYINLFGVEVFNLRLSRDETTMEDLKILKSHLLNNIPFSEESREAFENKFSTLARKFIGSQSLGLKLFDNSGSQPRSPNTPHELKFL